MNSQNRTLWIGNLEPWMEYKHLLNFLKELNIYPVNIVLKPKTNKKRSALLEFDYVYSTYQAVSGAGQKGVEDLKNTLKGFDPKKFPYAIANNCLPHIDVFTDNGYTKEEIKMINETRKILHRPNLRITATTVRVPVINSHSESINIEFEKSFKIEDIKDLLRRSPGIIVEDNIENNVYPLATHATGTDEVYVGRIRKDDSVEHGINIWVVADNVRKGAASNAIQIVEKIISN